MKPLEYKRLIMFNLTMLFFPFLSMDFSCAFNNFSFTFLFCLSGIDIFLFSSKSTVPYRCRWHPISRHMTVREEGGERRKEQRYPGNLRQ